jgi:hypothetical protein
MAKERVGVKVEESAEAEGGICGLGGFRVAVFGISTHPSIPLGDRCNDTPWDAGITMVSVAGEALRIVWWEMGGGMR